MSKQQQGCSDLHPSQQTQSHHNDHDHLPLARPLTSPDHERHPPAAGVTSKPAATGSTVVTDSHDAAFGE